MICTQEILCFIYAESFVHDHGDPGDTWLLVAIRDLRKIKIHGCAIELLAAKIGSKQLGKEDSMRNSASARIS
jgi:hypothetical protein